MGEIKIQGPLLVGRSGDTLIIAGSNFRTDPLADAQLWTPTNGYSKIAPLQVHLKFLYYVEEITPPQPWIEPSNS